MTSHVLFEALENAGLVRGNDVDAAALARMPVSELLDLAQQAAESTSTHDLSRADSIFTHTATISLGGGNYPCSAVDCRVAHAQELAQFASLYSDRVYIHNFLMDHTAHRENTQRLDHDYFKQRFFTDLVVLTELRPLIEAGFVVPITPPGDRCPHCLAERDVRPEDRKKLFAERRRLARAFDQEMNVSIEKRGDMYGVLIEAPEHLLEHGIAYRYGGIPKELQGMPRLVSRIEAGERVSLSRASRRKLAMHDRLAVEVFKNILFELAIAQTLNTSFLTERSIHLEILNALTADPDVQRRNHLVERHLTTMVPFVGDVPTDHLLQLREREQEAFVLFRQALNEAIDASQAQRGHFNESDAKQIYSDVLAPRLTQLDQKVRLAKRGLQRATLGKAAAWGGAITFGMYTGLLPGSIAVAAQALGLVNILGGAAEALLEKAASEDAVREDSMYFLWRARQLVKLES